MASEAVSSPFAFPLPAGGDDTAAPPPPAILERMAAGAFLSLRDHLRDRSDQVSNMALMTVGGFCRNCLAKWMVLEARRLRRVCVDDADAAAVLSGSETASASDQRKAQPAAEAIAALDSFGYDDAARDVYGEAYPEWKKKHQRKATDEELRRYEESARLHATHDSEALRRIGPPSPAARLSDRALIRLRAGAFLSLCRHLRDRSDQVSNMALMTVGGFCRNCLAKWLVVEARRISDRIGADSDMAAFFPEQRRKAIESLDSLGYDEAARYVYGCTYPEWKKRHQKKATDEQLERYNGSKHLHARHDKELLATRNDGAPVAPAPPADDGPKAQVCVKEPTQQNALLSDVCCQDVDTVAPPAIADAPPTNGPRRVPAPPKGKLELSVGVLTVSDRAAAGAYATGDLSGPAVEGALAGAVDRANASRPDRSVAIARVERRVVPDEPSDVREALLLWSGGGTPGGTAPPCDLVLTTGGTGFGPRDVTPEATLAVVDRECRGLTSWAGVESTSRQPLATLSRAAAGTRGRTVIVNLPGNPRGAAEATEVLFPLLLHAIADLRGGAPTEVVDG